MILCAAGDTHGAIDRLYQDVLRFEAALGLRFNHVLHVGDFGVWPDTTRIDRATRRHDGAGDFPTWHTEGRAAPRPTLFIKGNHEDFAWLDARPGGEVLPGLRYLPNGTRLVLPGGVTVRGIGGCHGPSNYERAGRSLQGAARRHYTRDEVERLGAGPPVDVLLLHDAPAGVVFEKRFPSGDPRRYASEAGGLAELVRRLRLAFRSLRLSITLRIVTRMPWAGVLGQLQAGTLRICCRSAPARLDQHMTMRLPLAWPSRGPPGRRGFGAGGPRGAAGPSRRRTRGQGCPTRGR